MFQLNDRPTNNNINNNNNNDNNKTKQRQPQREWQRSLPFIARSLLPNPPSAIFLRLTRGTVSWVVHLLVSHPLSGPTTLSSSYKCVPERSRSRTSVISMDPGEGVCLGNEEDSSSRRRWHSCYSTDTFGCLTLNLHTTSKPRSPIIHPTGPEHTRRICCLIFCACLLVETSR